MKKIILGCLLVVSNLFAAEAPFHRGVNLTNWFQASNVRQIQFTKFTKQDFINIKSLGCDVIRLPINLHFMTSGAPDYTIDPLFYYFLDQVIDWTEELEIHLILDNHTFDPAENTDPKIGDVLEPVWRQMAAHYQDRSTFIYYEVLNEPHGIADKAWNDIQQHIVGVIRTIDQKHTIIIGPESWNSYNNFKYMPEYTDDNLIYTFHFYDPFLFTHQGASWTNPSMASLAGVPFPYDPARMPVCPPDLKGTWIEGSISSGYKTDGTVQRVQQLLDIAVDFQTKRNARLFCGEFGVYLPNSPDADRVYWYEVVRRYLEEKKIAWTIWDYTGGFGLFEPGSSELFEYDLNIPLVQALGLTAPPQKEFIVRPDSTGFDLYLDFVAPQISESSWSGDGLVDYYSETLPVRGKYCIYWTEVPQYCNVGFDFRPNKDLNYLLKNGYVVDFWIRSDAPTARIDIRFIDTKTDDPADHPWRMNYTIDPGIGHWDGDWHHLQIPLSRFVEGGSWDNEWFNPQGDFDWTAVDRFEFVSEHHDLKGMQFWLDHIRVVDPKESLIDKKTSPVPINFKLQQNYPNPFNNSTMIEFEVHQKSVVSLQVVDILGKKVAGLVAETKPAGKYRYQWDAQSLASGVYFYQLRVGSRVEMKKMILLQ